MKWESLSKTDAQKLMESWTDNAECSEDLSESYAQLRAELLSAFNETLNDLGINKSTLKGHEYSVDLAFGLEVYQLLNEKYQFSLRSASTEGIWRYLSIMVIPDIIEMRWGLNEGRFWKESRRIWLKALWWYIHLSWQGDKQSTLNILKGNTTDEIVQLVERSGANGYRVELYRYIMLEYGNLDSDQKKRGKNLFRRVMKLNTAKTKVIEPELVAGGVPKYVKGLFEYFEQREVTRHH